MKDKKNSKKSLVIVESPTKAKTIAKILGSKFSVVPSMGHLVDLPVSKLGVDVEQDFKPSYTVIRGRKKIIAALKKEAKGKDTVYMATDPDREGEAIGWQIKDRVLGDKKEVKRVVFHEITETAIKQAFDSPRGFDAKMIEAQASRRILDRIVGYFLSPLLWKKVARGLSAGRVQSVALRLVVDRERQIRSFVPQEYWQIEAELRDPGQGESFLAKLEKIGDEKAQVKNQVEADSLCADIKSQVFVVSDVRRKEKKRNPSAPFITSTLQQEAFNKLRFSATKTMIVAQQLYEGVEVGSAGPVGLITYMRTDSTRAAPEAIKQVRAVIAEEFGRDYLPDEANIYKLKKHAQAAHEAIRPTSLLRRPADIKPHLSPEQYKLYTLIYNRFLASQMSAARYLATAADIAAGKYLFCASGSKLVFDGFLKVYRQDIPDDEAEGKNNIPELSTGTVLELAGLLPSQHFTKPPPRFSDSSLVKLLEENGIGRPSTYAPIISTLIYRDYMRRIKGYFYATELGEKICGLLVEYFPQVMDVEFTAWLEDQLDEVEESQADSLKLLRDFYGPFKERLDFAEANIQKEVVQTEESCDSCGRPMIIKWGRKGKFLSCSGFPECRNAKSITTGVKCPQPGCTGELIQRHSRRGSFFGCSKYPDCKFISKELPVPPSDTEAGQPPAQQGTAPS